jgi:beta-lactamase superfamily II metal-dependent hydrolase
MESVNNKSVVLEVTFGESSFFFMGDAETEVETHLIEELKVHDIDVLKVGHHGSCTSSSFKFLEAARPNIAVYSARVDNSYGHPCVDTINRLTSLGCTVYGTDQRGTIVVSSDGQTETVTFL